MMIQAMMHAFLLALGLILPLGAQNIFVFNQGASQKHFRNALPVVITAGLCDTLLISAAVLGVSIVLMGIPTLQIILYIVGICFLTYMCISIWRSTGMVKREEKPLSAKQQVLFALSVSLLNPHAIMDTIGVIGTSSAAYSGHEKAAFTLICIGVSWVWFLGLAVAGKMIGHLDKEGRMINIINKLSAVIIAVVIFILIRQLLSLMM